MAKLIPGHKKSENINVMGTSIRNVIQATLAFFIGYMGPNYFQYFTPYVLQPSKWDLMISFNPLWVWIYILIYPLIFTLYFSMDWTRKLQMEKAVYITALFGATIFFLFPTTIPREVVFSADTVSGYVLGWVYVLDNPVNCLPSFHIALTTLAAYYASRNNLQKTLGFGLVVLIAFSAIGLKQHYVIDLTCGFLLAILVIQIEASNVLSRAKTAFNLKF